MSFFSKIFGFFSDFFSVVAKTLIGKSVEEISETALEIVEDLERFPTLSGEEKYRKARDFLKSEYPSAKSAAINLAIESAVAIIKDQFSD